MLKTDILVIGTGLAGAISAIIAADNNQKVTIITKTDTLISGSTANAQGGIIYRGINDSKEKLVSDIMFAGAGHCWQPAVMQLADWGSKLVDELLINRFKINFDSQSAAFDKHTNSNSGIDENFNNNLHLTSEGAHSVRRIIHSKDLTGLTIQKAVINELQKNPNIEIRTNNIVVDLLTLSHHSKNSLDIYKHPACFGAIIFDSKTNKTEPIFAKKTILATGGLGQIFLHTTNPPEATGDGIALASRAGVRCFNLEYIQFHPTAFYSEHQDRFLISEALRGEGGVLIDKNGNEFMSRFHSQGNLAPRDVVARSIQNIMLETSAVCVYLDISFKGEDWLKDRFPTIFNHCLDAGINIGKEPIPVVPAAHYSCGGVGVNLNGRTSLQRLYAVGEIACTGVHGANRLASSALLEALVWGYKAGIDVSIPKDYDEYFPEIYDWVSETETMDAALLAQDWTSIKNTMWNYVGLIRTKQRLHRAKKMLRELQLEIEQFYKKAKLSREIIELRNGIETAIAVTNATIESPVSRGTHYISK
jgi:L-aspartate oxidase